MQNLCSYVFIKNNNVKTIVRVFQCVEQSGLSVDDINSCYTSQEGYQLMLNSENETKTMTPGPLFVPTIVFSDVRDHFYILHIPNLSNAIMIYFIIIYFLRNTTKKTKSTHSPTLSRRSVRN